MKFFTAVATLGAVSAADELQAYVDCTTLVDGDDTDALYDAMVSVNACEAQTADECATAALAAIVALGSNDGEQACVQYESTSCDTEGEGTCNYALMDTAGAAADSWEPRTCVEDENFASALVDIVVTGDASAYATTEVADCPAAEEEVVEDDEEEDDEDDEEDDEDSAASLTAGVAVFMAALINM